MESNLKKMWPALAVAFTTLTSVACAVDDMQVRNLENRVNALEQRRGANGMINPPARPVVRDGTDLWVQAEVLFMKTTEDGLDYAIKTPLAAYPSSPTGHVKNGHYDWNWGFRLGLGYNTAHDGWDMLLNWTWFQARGRNAETPKAPYAVGPTQLAPDFGSPDARAKSHTTLHLNFLDFELGREFFVSRWLTLRPFVGARGAWLHRDFHVNYLCRICDTKHAGHDHNRFRGGGLRTGLNTQWGLGCGWSFFGDLALSLILGGQKLNNRQRTLDLATSARTTSLYLKDHWTTVRPMLEINLGLRWDHLFGCNDAYRIRIQLGWEQMNIFGFAKELNCVNASLPGKFIFNQGDLALNGLSLQFRFDF
jgi:hypothetical protein